jgi:hypothetical protein
VSLAFLTIVHVALVHCLRAFAVDNGVFFVEDLFDLDVNVNRVVVLVVGGVRM